jgi:DNA repair photolyase
VEHNPNESNSPPGAAPAARSLDGIVEDLLLPLLRAVPRPGGWRLVNWDCEQGIGVTIARGDVKVLVEFERHDLRRGCYARTARFNVCARRAFEATTPLSDDDRRAVDQLVDLVRRREGRLPVVSRPAPARGAIVREVRVERLLMPEGAGHYYINPYVGCMIGCEFCYVAERADLSREIEGLPMLPWGRYVDVKINAAEVLAREVARMPPGVVRMSPIVTDPYQPLEKRYGITRACLELLLAREFAPVVLTRSALVERDLDLLARFPRAAVGLSIPTDDDRVRAQFEPGGAPIEDRFAALERCSRAGVRTFGVVQPVLPMDPERLVDRMAPFVRAVRVDRMQHVAGVGDLYVRAGCEHAHTDTFFDDMRSRLVGSFALRGIAVDELDDLGALVHT